MVDYINTLIYTNDRSVFDANKKSNSYVYSLFLNQKFNS